MITIEEVNKFLDEFKVKAKVFGIIYHERSKDCIVLNFRLLINQNAKNDIAGTAILVKCRMSTFLSPCCTRSPATASSALAVPTKSPYAERGYDWHPQMP